ncbi:hypothetical protein SprV_0301096800 [Sparganum proliferum]
MYMRSSCYLERFDANAYSHGENECKKPSKNHFRSSGAFYDVGIDVEQRLIRKVEVPSDCSSRVRLAEAAISMTASTSVDNLFTLIKEKARFPDDLTEEDSAIDFSLEFFYNFHISQSIS